MTEAANMTREFVHYRQLERRLWLIRWRNAGEESNDALKLCPPATVESFEKPKTKWVSHYPPCLNVFTSKLATAALGLATGYMVCREALQKTCRV